jgi:hypothetical protein
MSSKPTFKTVRLSDVVEKPVEWLWPGRLPLGRLCLLDGDPDRGKSLLALDLAARLTARLPMPDGYVPPEACSVLILAREDELDDTIVPRLRAAGADLSRIHFLEARLEPDGAELPIGFPRDCDLLRDSLAQTDARLIIIDPLVAYLDAAVSCLNEQMARRALDPLAQVASEKRATMKMVRHLTKHNRTGPALHRGLGAVGIIGRGRSAFLVGRDPADPGLFLFAANKHNLGPGAPTLAYRVRANPEGIPVIDWQGVSPITVDDIVLNSGARFGDTIERAVLFLQEALADGDHPADEIRRQAADLGISLRTLERAKAQLHVKSCQVREHGRTVWHWRIPLGATPEEEMAALLKRLQASPDKKAAG